MRHFSYLCLMILITVTASAYTQRNGSVPEEPNEAMSTTSQGMRSFMNVEGVWHETNTGKATQIQTASLPSDKCNGNACGDVTITFLGDGQGYEISNDGEQGVNVRIRFTFGFQCLDWENIHLNPGESKTYLNGAYCIPVEATY